MPNHGSNSTEAHPRHGKEMESATACMARTDSGWIEEEWKTELIMGNLIVERR